MLAAGELFADGGLAIMWRSLACDHSNQVLSRDCLKITASSSVLSPTMPTTEAQKAQLGLYTANDCLQQFGP